jgi:hypothetical protein
VTLTDDEADAYAEISAKLARFFPSGDEADVDLEQAALRLLVQRARLLAGAVIYDFLVSPPDLGRGLGGCGVQSGALVFPAGVAADRGVLPDGGERAGSVAFAP